MQAISAALVKAQRGFAPALKTSSNPHFKSKYADLAACVEAVIDSLNANGIALIQKQHPCDHGVSVETVFLHESGESLSAGVLTVPASKQDPQGYGSALTYARRYSLMAACGIAPEDDDGNAASKRNQAAQQPADSENAKRLAFNALTPDWQAWMRDFAVTVENTVASSGGQAARDLIDAQKGWDNELELALFDVLGSRARAAIKATTQGQPRKAA